MKKTKISLEAHVWYRKEIEIPYRLLKIVFFYTSPSELRTDFNELIRYVNSSDICMSRTPAKCLEVYSFLQSIIRVSYKMYCKPLKYHLQVPIRFSESTEFNDFIGNLLFDEYLDPYLAFKNVFEKQSFIEIEIDLYEIVQYALGSFTDDPPADNISITFININKLLDACWLIHKREYFK